jgi:cation/acetate symporter
MIALGWVIAVTLATILLGVWATKRTSSAADFFVAGRSVNVFWNASAISGEYLSAASFMGIAGLVMKNGYDALWYPVGYAAGYLFLLLFIAGPLRRFGAYTIPDFAEGRFHSPAFRKIAVSFVLFIGFFYTMPQMKGAGITMVGIMGWPYWVGIAVVGSVITFNVAIGGMKGITLVQAAQYWIKVFAISVPVFVVMSVVGGYNKPLEQAAENAKGVPMIADGTIIKVKGRTGAPNNTLTIPAGGMMVEFLNDTVVDRYSPIRKQKPGEEVPIIGGQIAMPNKIEKRPGETEEQANRRVTREVGGAFFGHPSDQPNTIKKGEKEYFGDHSVQIEKGLGLGNPPVMENGKPVTTQWKLEFGEPAELKLTYGYEVTTKNPSVLKTPNAPTNEKWLNPFGPLTSKHGYPLLYTYSLIVALVCGTAGLPHILVRFYTNPDGKSAKRTTLWVMVMLGAFYVFTPMWGALGRLAMPVLYAGNATDQAVIKLPTMIGNPFWGQMLSGVTAAGAFAAFMSTFSGLLVSMSGAFAHDMYGRILKPTATPQQKLVAFKAAAIGIGVISMLLGLLVENFDIAIMVGWAFAIGAASYFPLLLLGSWWRGLTATGAATGMLTGGLSSLAAIVFFMLTERKYITATIPPLAKALIEQPAIWGVPLAIITMIVVSKLTASRVPEDVDTIMLRLHAPEELGVSKNFID